jgi:hypothetical protein
MKKVFTIIFFLFLPFITYADCVRGAKDKTEYKVINTGYGAEILFSGGYGADFIIELDGSIYYETLDEIYFIKDDFCDWDSDVIVIDGEVFGVKTVSQLEILNISPFIWHKQSLNSR